MMTISEALAEIKLINNKIQKKQEWVLQNLTRAKHVADPLIEKGGIATVMNQELQSIQDLSKRYVVIRKAIMESNLVTLVTVLNDTMSVYEWLVWKKDVANQTARFSQSIYTNTKRDLDRLATQPQAAKTEDNKTILLELEANVDYMKCTTDAAYTQEILDKLDGVLSFKNATTTIQV